MSQKVIIGPLYAPHYTLSCNNAYYTEIETFEKMIESEICLNPDRIWRIWKKDSEYYIEYELGEDENEEIKKLVKPQLPQGAVLDTDCTTINVDDFYCQIKCGIRFKEYVARRILTLLKEINIECPIEKIREALDAFVEYDAIRPYDPCIFAMHVEREISTYNNCEWLVEVALLYLSAYDNNASWPESWTIGNLREIEKRIEMFAKTKDPNVFRGLEKELVC
jgi:hypothetical protein